MCFKPFVTMRLLFLVLITCKFSFSQLEESSNNTTQEITESPEILTTVMTEEPDTDLTTDSATKLPSEAICAVCECTDGNIDCSYMNITTSFGLNDWDAVAGFNPKTVDLSQNSLKTFTKIGELPIEVLIISDCDIEKIEVAAFSRLDELRSLDLSRNKLATSNFNKMVLCGPLNKIIGPTPFKHMENLSLADNDIHSLPQDLFAFMDTLTSLDLSGNPLAYIDQVTMGAISDLAHLKRLGLSGCELETLPEGFLRRLKKLRYLDLSDNRFATVPSVLQEAPKLVFLSLDKNPIPVLSAPSAISKLISLRELHLCRMSRLQNITAGGLGGLANLEILRMSYNPRLTNISPHFLMWKDDDGEEQWPIVKELYLNNNNLTSIDSHMLDTWNELISADFSNNPYVCDCHRQWMVDVLVPMLANMKKTTENPLLCKKPRSLRGQTFWMLNNSSKILICEETEAFKEGENTANLAIILGILIGITVTFPIVLILVLLWRKGYFARYCRAREGRKVPYPGYDDDDNEYL